MKPSNSLFDLYDPTILTQLYTIFLVEFCFCVLGCELIDTTFIKNDM